MKTIKSLTFLLFTMFASYSFAAENCKNQLPFPSSAFNAYLMVKEVHDEGLVLVLNDGSEWDIKSFGEGWKLLGWGLTEQQQVSHWTIEDTIEIQYPGSGNFTDFFLLIKNLSRKEEAWATLKQTPSVNYSACLWIANFDEETNYITLSNGTACFKTTTDMYGAFFQKKPHSLTKWKSGDILTLIKVEGWFNANTFLLWNHVTNEMPVVKD